jgi:Tfp pilus assembly protein PilN
MIEINLLPEELKARIKKAPDEYQYFLYLIPLCAAVLVLVHLYLGGIQTYRSLQLSALTKKWQGLEPQRSKLVNLKSESSSSSQEDRIAQEFAAKSINWSKKLNKLSLDLVAGIWFNEISISRTGLSIRATVFSLEKAEVDLINKLMTGLKNDSDFIADFESLELGQMQRKSIASYEVVDFMLSANLKPR